MLCFGYMRPVSFSFHALISRRQFKGEETRSSRTNVESQSSVRPIPINYFTSPNSSAGIVCPPPRGEASGGSTTPIIWRCERPAKQLNIHKSPPAERSELPSKTHNNSRTSPEEQRGQRKSRAAFGNSDYTRTFGFQRVNRLLNTISRTFIDA